MELEKLDKYVKGKRGVTVRRSGDFTRYLLNDRMFAMSFYSQAYGNVITLKAKESELAYYRNEYGGKVIPSTGLEPLHWNDFLLDFGISDDVILRAVDESYEIFASELSAHAKKALDEQEPEYKYVFKNFDLAKVMRSLGEKQE